jgi:hypothetical protein
MAHPQKPDFVFRRNGRVYLNRRGRQFSRLLAAEVCASAVVTLDTPCSEVVWRVLAIHSIRQFPFHFPSSASPCAITFQLDSTWEGMWKGKVVAYFSTSVVLSRDWWRDGQTRKLLHCQWMTSRRLDFLNSWKWWRYVFSEIRESITLVLGVTTQKIRILDGRVAGKASERPLLLLCTLSSPSAFQRR